MLVRNLYIQDFSLIEGDLYKKLFVVIACIIMLYAHIFLQAESLVTVALIVGGLIVSVETSVCLYICSIILQIEYSELHSRLIPIYLVCILLYVLVKYNIAKKLSKVFVLCLVFWICSVVSIIFGYKTVMVSSLFVMMQLLLILSVTYFCKKNSSLFLIGFIVSGLCVFLYTIYLYITGNIAMFGASIVYGDGEEAGQVKSLAIAAAVPTYYYVYNLFYSKEGIIKKLLYGAIIIAGIIIIILTYSRGVLIALAVSSVLLVFYFFKDKYSFIKILITCVVCLVLYRVLLQVDINEDKMFGSIEGANGRTDIWAYFFSKMQDGGLMRILFGFGPGDSKRITEGSLYSDLYSHSAILDYFFLYGVCGLVFIGYFLWKTSRNLFRQKNVFALGLFVLTVLMFITHGTSSNVIFNSLLSICMGCSLKELQYKYKGDSLTVPK